MLAGMQPASQFTSFLGEIPSGREGVKATLKIMVMIARKCNSALPVRILAQQLVQSCPENDKHCEAATLHAYVRDAVRYVADIRNKETIQFPEQTLQLRSGDCDDKALLLATLLESIGFSTRFCAVKTDGSPIYSHVLTQVLIPREGWISAEVIPIDGAQAKAPLGWFPPNATCYMLAHV
jgi:hypothetical protein